MRVLGIALLQPAWAEVNETSNCPLCDHHYQTPQLPQIQIQTQTRTQTQQIHQQQHDLPHSLLLEAILVKKMAVVMIHQMLILINYQALFFKITMIKIHHLILALLMLVTHHQQQTRQVRVLNGMM